MSAATTTPEAPTTRTRAQVVEDLIARLTARQHAKTAAAKKPIAQAITALEGELLTAPVKGNAAKGSVVDTAKVLKVLKASKKPMSAEAIATAIGCEATAGIKARIAGFLSREASAKEATAKTTKAPATYSVR